MPIINTDDYRSPFWLPARQSQSIFPSLFRKVEGINYVRERICTNDGDFLDVDFSKTFSTQSSNQNTRKAELVIFSHGLEGDTSRQYITGMVKNFNNHGFDCLAWNFRSCSGELNQTKRFYHSGATDDLENVIKFSLLKGYHKVYFPGVAVGVAVARAAY